MSTTMKEAHVHADTSVTLHDVPLPEITDPHQMIIQVIVAGCNPKDWKMPAGLLATIADCPNSGDELAGIVHAVGSSVTSFHVGDRVAALHQLGAPYGAYAEYALVWDHAAFHLPRDYPFEAAATLPMGALMAGLGLFGMLKVTETLWAPLEVERPLVIYGAAGTVGSFALKLAINAGIHPLICVAGRGMQFVEGLIDRSKGDVVIDYRDGDDAVVEGMRKALDGRKLEYALDAVSEKGSYLNICEVLDPDTGHISLVLPQHQKETPPKFRSSLVMVGSLWQGFRRPPALIRPGLEEGHGYDFGCVMSTMLGRWTAEGKLRPHQYTVVDGGLQGVETALKDLRTGKNSAMKYVVRVADTPGLARR